MILADRSVLEMVERAVRDDDLRGLAEALDPIEMRCLWPRVMHRISALPPAGPNIREGFARIWLTSGDHIRQETLNDRCLVRALCTLMPAYTGPHRTLYRGEGAMNRRHRTYGLSWSASEEVAESFAQGFWRTGDGGSVLLRAEAPAEAIIYAPPVDDDRYGEEEYVVDPRMLIAITVLGRFPQLTHAEFAKHKRLRTALGAERGAG